MATLALAAAKRNLERATYFLDIHEGTQEGPGTPNNKRRELTRGSVVFAIGALDAYLSEVAAEVIALQKRLSERQKLLSQLDQAKMQEQMNKAMAQLSETVGQDVPTLEEVRDEIEQRYARAVGAAELQGETVEARMLEVEQAAMDSEAQHRLSQIRAQLGLEPAAAESGGTPAVETGGGTAEEGGSPTP